MMTSKIKTILWVGCLSFVVNACSNTDSLLSPTGKAAFVPADDVEFTQYVSDSHKNIELELNEFRKCALSLRSSPS